MSLLQALHDIDVLQGQRGHLLHPRIRRGSRPGTSCSLAPQEDEQFFFREGGGRSSYTAFLGPYFNKGPTL